QNRRCLNGSDAALDTKAIRQKRGRHRAEKIALTEDLRQACAAEVVVGEGASTNVTISIGLAQSHGEMDLGKVMRMADQALYAAKHRGRNRVVRADVLADSVAA
ncbi:diguanylate cyclase, partial [Bradyrhizobium sp. 151]|uniref:GGDEF domain-containing protein n=1 Tax=Bradyrhizobium sp. 151 TaxID=2782626 RepID=UPI001FF80A93